MCFFRFCWWFAWGWAARTAAAPAGARPGAVSGAGGRGRGAGDGAAAGGRLAGIATCAPFCCLPIGGLFAYADPESQEGASQGGGQFALALAGPLANLATALLLAAAFLGASGNIKLLSQPWISSAWLVRSMVWMQAGLGLLHLLPAYPLDGGRLLRSSFARKHGVALCRPHRCRAGPGAGAGRHGGRYVAARLLAESSPASSS